ncbi:MAG: alpha/beta fold hydrolase [Candidatus Coatesbacteria bacterium]
MGHRVAALASVLVALVGTSAALGAGVERFSLRLPDGIVLPASAEEPAPPAPGQRVVILLHGSGPQDMDEDLSGVSQPGIVNRFFVDLSTALRERGFTVVRYNKRSREARVRLQADPSYAKTKSFKDYASHPLAFFVDDARAAVRWSAKRYPKAGIFLLGHSEGGIVALHVARREKAVSGVGIIGFGATSLDTTLFEQVVVRQIPAFEAIDADHDGRISGTELNGSAPLAVALKAQMSVVDLDGDGAVSRDEFLGAQLSNIVVDAPRDSMREYRRDEAALPRAAEEIRDLAIPVAIFQGEWDNQTPAYHARAVELLNRMVWKKTNLSFWYYPRLGHALDSRPSPGDLVFRHADAEALASVAARLDALSR